MIKAIIQIKDLKTGKSTFRDMHSFVSNFLASLSYGFGFEADFSMRTRENTNYGLMKLKHIIAGNDDETYGMLLGLGNTPSALDDRALEEFQTMHCGSVSITNPVDKEGLRVLTIARSFENTTASDIIINEFGLFMHSGVNDNPYLITRDILDAPETFHPGDSKMFKLHIGFASNLTDWFLLLLQYRFLDITAEVKNTEGNYENTNFYDHDLNALTANKAWGIVIGNGTTSPTRYDFAMENRIYSLWDYSDVYLDHCIRDTENKKTDLKIYRRFTNNTGSPQSISEVGIIVAFGPNSYQKCMIAHYVIDPVEIADGQSCNVYWNFSTPILSYDPPENPPE
jgi:hypothetical protein